MWRVQRDRMEASGMDCWGCFVRICDEFNGEFSGISRCIAWFDLVDKQTKGTIVICGDSYLVIRQTRGEIDYKAPGIQ